MRAEALRLARLGCVGGFRHKLVVLAVALEAEEKLTRASLLPVARVVLDITLLPVGHCSRSRWRLGVAVLRELQPAVVADQRQQQPRHGSATAAVAVVLRPRLLLVALVVLALLLAVAVAVVVLP